MVWLKLTRVYGTTALPSKLTILLLCAHQNVVLPPSHQQVPVTIVMVSLCKKECTANCTESYEAKSSATALTGQICHVDGYTHADTGLQFPSCVTTKLSQCSDSPIAKTEKFDALDCTNLTVGGTCIVGYATGYKLASGDSLRSLTCVSENESVACLTGSWSACQVTRCSTSLNPVPIGVRIVKSSDTAPLVK